MPQRSDVIPRPDFDPLPGHVVGAQAGLGTGVLAGALTTVVCMSPSLVLPLLLVGCVTGTLAGALFDRVSRSREAGLFPISFGVLGGFSSALTLALLPVPQAVWATAPLMTTGLALASGGLAGTLLGALAAACAGHRDPKNPLPSAGRTALVAGLGTFAFTYGLGSLGAGLQAAGPLSTALVTLAYGVRAVGPFALGMVGALAAGAGALLATGRQAWAEQDCPSGTVMAGSLLHASSELHRSLTAGEDPTL